MEDNIPKVSWIEDHKLTSVIIVMFIIWFSLLAFWSLKTDEITKDPCSICSAKMGEDVVCRTQGFISTNRVYYPNGSTYQEGKIVT